MVGSISFEGSKVGRGKAFETDLIDDCEQTEDLEELGIVFLGCTLARPIGPFGTGSRVDRIVFRWSERVIELTETIEKWETVVEGEKKRKIKVGEASPTYVGTLFWGVTDLEPSEERSTS
jgi:hypothetical protein